MQSISFGSRGIAVTLAQRLLNRRLGGGTLGVDETGEYGDRTRLAVAEFQKRQRITAEPDTIGSHTWAALGLTVDVSHTVPLVPQLDEDGSWAAAAAMAMRLPSIMGFEEIVPPPGVDLGGFRTMSALQSLAGRFFWSVDTAPLSTGMLLSLANRRTAWLAGTTDTGSNHAVTITGAMGDGTDNTTFLLISDPKPIGIGSTYPVAYSSNGFETGGGRFKPLVLVVPG